MKNFRKKAGKCAVAETGVHPWGSSYGYVWAPDGARYTWEAEKKKKVITVSVSGDKIIFKGASKREAIAHIKMWALCMSREDMSYFYPKEGVCESSASE